MFLLFQVSTLRGFYYFDIAFIFFVELEKYLKRSVCCDIISKEKQRGGQNEKTMFTIVICDDADYTVGMYGQLVWRAVRRALVLRCCSRGNYFCDCSYCHNVGNLCLP